jgi:hypothetical protein
LQPGGEEIPYPISHLSQRSLYVYAQGSLHRAVMAQRRRWFQRFDGPYSALWWVPQGHIPTVEEAKERLEHLREHGDTLFAFSLKRAFPAPDATYAPLSPVFEACLP